MQQSKVTRFPAIPEMTPITTRPVGLSNTTRIEVTASIIACVLSDAFQGQQDLPHRMFTSLDPAVRRVYEGIARGVTHSLLLPERTMQAERKAVDAAASVLDHYADTDADLGVRVDPQQARQRIKTAFLSALHAYQTEMAREER